MQRYKCVFIYMWKGFKCVVTVVVFKSTYSILNLPKNALHRVTKIKYII